MPTFATSNWYQGNNMGNWYRKYMYIGILTCLAEHEYRNNNNKIVLQHIFNSEIPPIAKGCCTIVPPRGTP